MDLFLLPFCVSCVVFNARTFVQVAFVCSLSRKGRRELGHARDSDRLCCLGHSLTLDIVATDVLTTARRFVCLFPCLVEVRRAFFFRVERTKNQPLAWASLDVVGRAL